MFPKTEASHSRLQTNLFGGAHSVPPHVVLRYTAQVDRHFKRFHKDLGQAVHHQPLGAMGTHTTVNPSLSRLSYGMFVIQ